MTDSEEEEEAGRPSKRRADDMDSGDEEVRREGAKSGKKEKRSVPIQLTIGLLHLI